MSSRIFSFDNLFTAFPKATKIAFTGTPLLTERHTLKTHERFGTFIDKYKIRQSVKDRATLDIVYIIHLYTRHGWMLN
jgi:type I restriction enzyme R subunit